MSRENTAHLLITAAWIDWVMPFVIEFIQSRFEAYNGQFDPQ